MEDYFTDMTAWNAENEAFLIKIGQIEKPKTKTKKDEE